MKKKFMFFVGVVCISSFLSVFAFADTIEAAYLAVDAGGQEGINLSGSQYNGANGAMIFDTRNPVGSLAQQIPSHTWMYCHDLFGYMDFSYAQYDVITPEADLGVGKGELIRQLWAQHYDNSWQTDTYIYIGDGYGGFLDGQPLDTSENQRALAFSFALYEIAYDFDGTMASLNLAAGPLQAGPGASNPPESVGIATGWLNSLVLPSEYTGPLANLVVLTDTTHNPKYQTLITQIPEPATVALFALGVLGLFRRKG